MMVALLGDLPPEMLEAADPGILALCNARDPHAAGAAPTSGALQPWWFTVLPHRMHEGYYRLLPKRTSLRSFLGWDELDYSAPGEWESQGEYDSHAGADTLGDPDDEEETLLLSFLSSLLSLDPQKRPSASKALQHPWLTRNGAAVSPPMSSLATLHLPSVPAKLASTVAADPTPVSDESRKHECHLLRHTRSDIGLCDMGTSTLAVRAEAGTVLCPALSAVPSVPNPIPSVELTPTTTSEVGDAILV